jgi:hypothetical protein
MIRKSVALIGAAAGRDLLSIPRIGTLRALNRRYGRRI